MKHSSEVRSKLDMDDERVTIPVQETVSLVSDIFENLGCSGGIAHEVAAHLVDANLCGLESHGLMRTLQYADQFESGSRVTASGHAHRAIRYRYTRSHR